MKQLNKERKKKESSLGSHAYNLFFFNEILKPKGLVHASDLLKKNLVAYIFLKNKLEWTTSRRPLKLFLVKGSMVHHLSR
jgi:hypothetical protein